MSDLQSPETVCYIPPVPKGMVLENTYCGLRLNRPVSAVLSCPNSVESYGQDGVNGNATRTARPSVFNILPTPVLENAVVESSLGLGA